MWRRILEVLLLEMGAGILRLILGERRYATMSPGMKTILGTCISLVLLAVVMGVVFLLFPSAKPETIAVS